MPNSLKCSLRREESRKKYTIFSSSCPNLRSDISTSKICFLVSWTVFSRAISLLRVSCFSNFSIGESGLSVAVPFAVAAEFAV